MLQGLEQAFHAFGGVPRELLCDQLKAVILADQRPGGGRVLENPRPYRAQTKGKVERPVRYVRRSFVYGRAFAGDADLNAQALAWLAHTANVRLHRTTGERPVDRFARDERAALQPLAARPYQPLVLPPERPIPVAAPPPVAHVVVEQRPLAVSAALAAETP